jgi:hypothetical protein
MNTIEISISFNEIISANEISKSLRSVFCTSSAIGLLDLLIRDETVQNRIQSYSIHHHEEFTNAIRYQCNELIL